MRIFGIDPGTQATGYGAIDSDGNEHSLVECGVIRSPRVAFAESLTVGQSICEYAPRSAGTAEIKALTQEILQHGQSE